MSKDSPKPARGYSWPPFEKGNMVTLRHGAYSPRRVDPLAEEILLAVLGPEQIAYLNDPTYSPALWAWGRAEARVQLLDEYVAKVGMFDQNGNVTPAYKEQQIAESAAMGHRKRLGLDPLSRAQLGRDLTSMSVDLARLWAGEDE